MADGTNVNNINMRNIFRGKMMAEKNFSKQENNSGFTEGENFNIIMVLQAEKKYCKRNSQ